MTTFETIMRVIGCFGIFALIGAYLTIGRDMNRRLNFLEDSRMAMLLTMGKMTKLIIEKKIEAGPTGSKAP